MLIELLASLAAAATWAVGVLWSEPGGDPARARAPALSYGLSDFVGGLVSRRTSAWAVAVVGGISSVVFTGLTALFFTGDPRPADFAWATAAGIGSGIGVGFLYRGFASGRMSVVAPVSAVGAALVPVLFGVVGGERPGLLVWLGIVLAAPAIWLVSSVPPTAERRGRPRCATGCVDGVLAGLGFGLLFACIGQVPRESRAWCRSRSPRWCRCRPWSCWRRHCAPTGCRATARSAGPPSPDRSAAPPTCCSCWPPSAAT